MKPHHRDSIRRAIRSAAAGALALAVGAGCESLRSLAPSGDPPTADTSSKTPVGGTTAKKPGKFSHRASQYVFFSDIQLEPSDPLFRELEGLPEQVEQELRLPPGQQLIQVYLFEDQEKYEAFMRDRFPWLPSRRAYFIAEQKRPGTDDLQVFTWMGEHIRTDLRHELTHATLHGVLKGVPIWLDEGLAGCFEQPPGMDGVNPAHLKALKDGPFQPDLARLERFGQVRQMEQPEYREAWAWTHFLLRDPRAKPVLLEYIGKLRDDPNPGPLLPRLQAAVGDPNRALGEHLARTSVPAATTKARAAANY